VSLIGGWSVAAALQSGGFDAVTGTISALAAVGADQRWVMSVAIAVTGVCHMITAAALQPAAPRGRLLLALGGAATVLVALLPLGAPSPVPLLHGAAALAAFVLLGVWPAAAPAPADARMDAPAAWGLRRGVSRTAAAVLLTLTAAFLVASVTGMHAVGAVERAAAAAQALWPAVVVASVPRLRQPSALDGGSARQG
jgi:hypothetical membrane protein